jgi:hypothetical protein
MKWRAELCYLRAGKRPLYLILVVTATAVIVSLELNVVYVFMPNDDVCLEPPPQKQMF